MISDAKEVWYETSDSFTLVFEKNTIFSLKKVEKICKIYEQDVYDVLINITDKDILITIFKK